MMKWGQAGTAGSRFKLVLAIVLVLLLFSMVFLFACASDQSKLQEQKAASISYQEYADIFEKYGISGATSDMLEKLEQYYDETPEDARLNRGIDLLIELGTGTYDYDSSGTTWTPSENGVYAFDTEMYDLNEMYMDFLSGVSALNREELSFTDVSENTDDVDWENGTGSRSVSFSWNGKTYTLNAEMYNDWFDTDVATQLNDIIKKNGNGKQLYFLSDGYQELIILYLEPDQATQFENDTGLQFLE